MIAYFLANFESLLSSKAHNELITQEHWICRSPYAGLLRLLARPAPLRSSAKQAEFVGF
jgi:hypothetical protein